VTKERGLVSKKGKFLLWLFFLVIFVGNAFYSLAQEPASADAYDSMARQILKFVNIHRDSINLPPLKIDSFITVAAITHSNDMAIGKVPLGHDGFEERMGVLQKQLKPANAAAENVADGVKSARQAVDLWLQSPGHRKNIEGNYNETGVGIVKAADGKLYFTQIFINKQ